MAAADIAWASGHGGLLVFDNNGGQGAGATFDNYRSGPLVPPVPAMVRDETGVVISWPAFPRCFKLQSNPGLDPASWTDADPASISYSAISAAFSYREPFSPLRSSGFFRLVRNAP